jgi:hypothetical protein
VRSIFYPPVNKCAVRRILFYGVFITLTLPRSGCPPQADSFAGGSATNEKINLCALCVSAVNKKSAIVRLKVKIQ